MRLNPLDEMVRWHHDDLAVAERMRTVEDNPSVRLQTGECRVPLAPY